MGGWKQIVLMLVRIKGGTMAEFVTRGRQGHSVSRRAVVSTFLALVLMVIGGVQTGSAEIEWCRVDPVIIVNGTTYNVIISSPASILDSATAATDVVVTVPAGADYALVATDNGFGFGETVTFVESSSRSLRSGAGAIGITVKVPSTTRLPVAVDVLTESAAVASTVGQTNQRVSLTLAT